MEKEYILSIANTIREQLVALNDMNVLMSWGIEHLAAIQYDDMAALKFHVNGRLFVGDVIIAYNASDTYEIYLRNKEAGTRCIGDDVYLDQMGEVIDVAVERGTDPEEYAKFCEEQRQKLINL
jgi:hypothetical protein